MFQAIRLLNYLPKMGNICPERVLIWHMQAQINMEIGSVNKELVNCFHFEVYATYSMLFKFIVIFTLYTDVLWSVAEN